jgi:hypothetical protein
VNAPSSPTVKRTWRCLTVDRAGQPVLLCVARQAFLTSSKSISRQHSTTCSFSGKGVPNMSTKAYLMQASLVNCIVNTVEGVPAVRGHKDTFHHVICS